MRYNVLNHIISMIIENKSSIQDIIVTLLKYMTFDMYISIDPKVN